MLLGRPTPQERLKPVHRVCRYEGLLTFHHPHKYFSLHRHFLHEELPPTCHSSIVSRPTMSLPALRSCTKLSVPEVQPFPCARPAILFQTPSHHCCLILNQLCVLDMTYTCTPIPPTPLPLTPPPSQTFLLLLGAGARSPSL